VVHRLKEHFAKEIYNNLKCLTSMEPCIARCVFYITNEIQLVQCSLLLSALYTFWAVFRPSSGAYKTVCAALGIVMLSCCLPLVWMGWKQFQLIHTSGRQQESMTIPKAAHTVL
jgi:hypothetical protein